ncbi:hypothetical protein AgCh_002610 [Apium graveolens]
MPLEPRASWFSLKCVEAQQLTGHLGGSRSASETMGDKLHRREGNSPDHQLRPLNDRSVIKEVGVQRQPGGSSTEGESGPKIRPKGVVDGQQCRKVKEVGDLMTGEPATEAPVNGGRNYNGPKVAKFLVGCGLPAPGQKDPMKLHCSLGLALGLLPGGPEPSVRYHSGRARILTLCQDLRAKGQSQVWHLDVGSSPPGAVVCSKGWAVRPLKRPRAMEQRIIPDLRRGPSYLFLLRAQVMEEGEEGTEKKVSATTGRIPSPIFTKKLNPQTEEGWESEEETDVEIETDSETKGTKQEQEGSTEEDPSPSLFSEEKEDLDKIDETEEIRVNGKEKTKDEFHFTRHANVATANTHIDILSICKFVTGTYAIYAQSTNKNMHDACKDCGLLTSTTYAP